MTIDEIYSYYNMGGVAAVSDITEAQNVESEDEKASETVGSVSAGSRDTYVSTISSEDTALRSENYNDIIDQIRKAKAARSEADSVSALSGENADTTAAAQAADSTAASKEGTGVASGGSGGSSDEEETTTIVVINGQRYLETTTTNSDGSTTVTKTPIGAVDSDAAKTSDYSSAAQALTLLYSVGVGAPT